VLVAIPFLIPLRFSRGDASDLRRIRSLEYFYWHHIQRLPRTEIDAVTVIAVEGYAVADTSIDTDNITLYEREPTGWKRSADLDTGSYCELRSHAVPIPIAYQLAWKVHWAIGADRYRDPKCI
jgi:hypothetical protein